MMINDIIIKLANDDVTNLAQELAFNHKAWADSNFKYPRELDKQYLVELIAERFVCQARDKSYDITTNLDHADKLARVFIITYGYYEKQYQLMNKTSIESFIYLVSELLRLGIETDPKRLSSSLITLKKQDDWFDE